MAKSNTVKKQAKTAQGFPVKRAKPANAAPKKGKKVSSKANLKIK